ncbi:MAG: hypothetical protein JG781_1536 [Peptococcaceae bacterium]|nr:hypothetical protein [Peptococcaceae bacterium]
MWDKIKMRVNKNVVKKTGYFLLINFILFLFTFPFVALYGPFDNLRNAAIGAVATSRHHHWLNYFMDQREIDKVMASPNKVDRISLKLPQFKLSHSNSIKLIEIEGARFKGFLLEVADPTRVKVGISEHLGKKGQTTSEIAKRYGAIAAINGGGFDDPQGKGTGAIPYGVVIQNGKFIAGENLKGPVNLVGLDGRGTLIVGNYTVSEMKKMQIREGVSFLPPLIINGKKQITQGDGGWGIAPRTAIGQRKDGTILLLVIDGRQPPYSIGATLADVQNILYENGAYTAANLDGGSSTAMYYNGKIINRPSNMMGILGERTVPTAFIVRK